MSDIVRNIFYETVFRQCVIPYGLSLSAFPFYIYYWSDGKFLINLPIKKYPFVLILYIQIAGIK